MSVILNLDELVKDLPHTPNLGGWVTAFKTHNETYEIDTANRCAAFWGQILHETAGLRLLSELWGPTKQQLGYEGRADLGNKYPGDGRLFRGRGCLQITGRANYQKIADRLGIPLIMVHPDMLVQPMIAMEASMIFWKDNNLNRFTDPLDVKRLTRRVNGGYNGLESRIVWTNKMLKVFSDG